MISKPLLATILSESNAMDNNNLVEVIDHFDGSNEDSNFESPPKKKGIP